MAESNALTFTERVEIIEDVLVIAAECVSPGYAFGGYVRDVLVPLKSKRFPFAKPTEMDDVDLWFGNLRGVSHFEKMMAKSPHTHLECGEVISPYFPLGPVGERRRYTLTNKGIFVVEIDVVICYRFPVGDFYANCLTYDPIRDVFVGPGRFSDVAIEDQIYHKIAVRHEDFKKQVDSTIVGHRQRFVQRIERFLKAGWKFTNTWGLQVKELTIEEMFGDSNDSKTGCPPGAKGAEGVAGSMLDSASLQHLETEIETLSGLSTRIDEHLVKLGAKKIVADSTPESLTEMVKFLGKEIAFLEEIESTMRTQLRRAKSLSRANAQL